MTLTEAVESLRRHDAQLVEFLDGLLGELGNIQQTVNTIKRSLLSQRGDTQIIDALDTLERIEQEWVEVSSRDRDIALRVQLDIFKRLRRLYPTVLAYLDREDRDPVVAAVAQDICDRSLELAEELPAALGLDAGRINMAEVLAHTA